MIYCSSLSKTLAPGWRIGWIAAGRYYTQVLQARMAGEWAGAPLLEAATSEMLASGDYDRHLRRLKRRIAEGIAAVVARVKASFPRYPRKRPRSWLSAVGRTSSAGQRAGGASPRAGVGYWRQPRPLFSHGAELTHFLRLNCANEPTPRLLTAVEQIGALCHELAAFTPDSPAIR